MATFGGNAAAREPSVLLLRPAHPSAVAAEAIVRLRGELLAAGYAVELADASESGGVRAAIETAARTPGVDAVVALFGDVPQDPGALWVIDRANGKTITRPIPHDAEGARSAQILSVRALELLRASFLEAALAPAARPPTPAKSPPAAPAVARTAPAVVANGSTAQPPRPAPEATGGATADDGAGGRDASPPPARPDEAREAALREPLVGPALARAAEVPARAPARLALEAGGLALGSLDGVPPAVLPLLRVTLVPVERWPLLARLTVAGLGTRSRVNGAEGDAEVTHQLATVEVLWAWRLGRRWQPFLSIGAGAAHLSAQGFSAASGATGRSASAWAFVGDAGAGLHVALSERLYLGGEAHAEGEAPYASIHYLGNQLATEGRPTLLAALSLLVWL